MTATVRVVDGQLVLDDPEAEAVFAAVEAHNRGIAWQNCRALLLTDAARMKHFVGRIAEKGLSPSDVVVTLIDVDDPNGRVLADILMPGHDWQAYRDRGERPIARGLAGREGLQDVLDSLSGSAGSTLRSTQGVALIVVTSGSAAVFTPEDLP